MLSCSGLLSSAPDLHITTSHTEQLHCILVLTNPLLNRVELFHICFEELFLFRIFPRTLFSIKYCIHFQVARWLTMQYMRKLNQTPFYFHNIAPRRVATKISIPNTIQNKARKWYCKGSVSEHWTDLQVQESWRHEAAELWLLQVEEPSWSWVVASSLYHSSPGMVLRANKHVTVRVNKLAWVSLCWSTFILVWSRVEKLVRGMSKCWKNTLKKFYFSAARSAFSILVWESVSETSHSNLCFAITVDSLSFSHLGTELLTELTDDKYIRTFFYSRGQLNCEKMKTEFKEEKLT